MNSHIPGLGLKGNNWFGPISLSWKTFRTSSHLFRIPNPDPEQNARRKMQFVHSSDILIKIPGLKKKKKKKEGRKEKKQKQRSPPVHRSGESSPHFRFQDSAATMRRWEAPDDHLNPHTEAKLQRCGSVWERHVGQVGWTDSRGGTVSLPGLRGRVCGWAAARQRHLVDGRSVTTRQLLHRLQRSTPGVSLRLVFVWALLITFSSVFLWGFLPAWSLNEDFFCFIHVIFSLY